MDLLRRLLYGAVGAATIFYFFVKYSLAHWKQRGILHERPTFLWGNVGGVGKRRHIVHALQVVYEKYKDTDAPFVGFYALIKPMVLMLRLDAIQRILIEDFAYFSQRGLYADSSADPLTANLVNLEGKEWQQLSHKLCPLFGNANLNQLSPILLQVAETFRATLKELHATKRADNCNIREIVECFNVDVIAKLAFGINNSNTLQNTDATFRRMCQQYMRKDNLLHEYLAFTFPSVARLLHYHSYDENAMRYFQQLVEHTIEERTWIVSAAAAAPQIDFLNIFANFKQHQQQQQQQQGEEEQREHDFNFLSKKEIAAQAFTFVCHGLDACNAVMTFCLYELALHPIVQDKLRTEIRTKLAQNDDNLNIECLKSMKYLEQVLAETLRLHPPYTYLLRQCVEDYDVPNSVFMLKQGNHIIIPIAAIHHDERIYPNPEKFDPDRFAPEARHRRHRMSWLPFGDGPRSCIALHYASMQALVGLVTLLRDFQFSPSSDTEIPFAYDFKQLLLRSNTDIRLTMDRV